MRGGGSFDAGMEGAAASYPLSAGRTDNGTADFSATVNYTMSIRNFPGTPLPRMIAIRLFNGFSCLASVVGSR